MIKANELRIGNLIMTDEFYLKVLSIHNIQDRGGRCDAEYSGLDDKKYFGLSQFYLDSSNPIPLTPEILEKAGFEKAIDIFFKSVTHDGWQIGIEQTDDFDIWYGKEEAWSERLPLVSIKSLHQLQNLYFALTGEELNIQL